MEYLEENLDEWLAEELEVWTLFSMALCMPRAVQDVHRLAPLPLRQTLQEQA